jgi:hypothetical protein
VKGSVAFVNLGETLGEKELVASRQSGRRERRCRVEKVRSGLVVKVRDRYQQPRQGHCAGHGMLLPCDRMIRRLSGRVSPPAILTAPVGNINPAASARRSTPAVSS